jgi:enediyne polyketide synthase
MRAGITAQCAFALAQATGARLALLGSSPAPDAGQRQTGDELSSTLARFQEAGLTARQASL